MIKNIWFVFYSLGQCGGLWIVFFKNFSKCYNKKVFFEENYPQLSTAMKTKNLTIHTLTLNTVQLSAKDR